MKKSLLLLFGGMVLLFLNIQTLQAQGCGEGTSGCDSAGESCYPVSGVLPMGQAGGQFPGCPANSLDNPVWYAVDVTCSGLVTVTITPSGCPGTNGARGAQSGFYADCDPASAPFGVQCGCTEGAMTHSAIVAPGIYYIMIDGCAGDECNYDIDVVGCLNNVPITGLIAPTVVPLDPCPGEKIDIIAGGVGGADTWIWSLPNGTAICSPPPHCSTISAIWGGGSGNVSFMVSNSCGEAATSPPTFVQSPVFTGEEYGDYCASDPMADGWYHIGTMTPYPGGTWTIPMFTARGCDSIVTLNVTGHITQPAFVIDFICEGEETCGNYGGPFNMPVDSTYVIPFGSINGFCDSTTIINVIQITPMVDLSVSGTLDCNNVGTGVIITADGSTLQERVGSSNTVSTGLTYNWSTSDGTLGTIANNVMTVTEAGTYRVEVVFEEDGECGPVICTVIDSIEVIGDFNYPELTIAPTNVSCGGGNNGTASVSVDAGTGQAPFTYNWSFGPGGSASINGLTAGWYYVTVEGDNGCTTIDSIQITQPMPVVATVVDSVQAGCGGQTNGEGTVAGSGGTPGYTYAWPATAASQTTATATGLASGSYTVTVTDANSCTATVDVIITEPSTIQLTEFTTAASCYDASDGSAYVTIQAGTPPFTYTWSNAAATTDSIISGVMPGSYSLTIEDNTGCNQIVSVTIGAPDSMDISVDVADTECFNDPTGTADITVTGGTSPYDYSWPAITGVGNTANGTALPTGIFVVTVTDANSCTKEVTIEIDEPDELVLTEDTNVGVQCFGGNDGQASVSAVGGTGTLTYAWSNSTTGFFASGLTANTYTVTVTDENGCTDEISVIIDQPDELLAVETDNQDVECFGDANGISTISASDGTPPYTYNWSSGGSVTATTNTLAAGMHTVTVTDANDCEVVVDITIGTPDRVAITLDDNTPADCFGASTGSLTVSASGGVATYTYVWSNSDTGPTATGLPAGMHTVTVTDQNGCERIQSFTITQPDELILSVDATMNVGCFNGANGSADLSTVGGSLPYTYSWPTTTTVGNTPNGTSLTAGTYEVTVTDDEGCTDVVSFMITQPDELSVAPDVITNVLCNGGADGTASFTTTGGSTPFTFSSVNTVTGDAFSGQNITSLPAGNYSLTVRDGSGCATQLVFDITEPDPIVVVETDNQDVRCFGEANGSATASASGGTPPFTYNWSVGAGATTNLLPVGTHIVTVTDANGCIEELSVTIAGPPELELDPGTIVDSPCFGTADGAASVVAGGGSPGYTYLWDAAARNQTDANATGLAAGNYTVTVTDASGCTQETMVTVGEADEFSATAVPAAATCFGDDDGQIVVSPSGGTAPFTYAIGSGPVTGPTITGLVAGNYTVVITDANGCTTSVNGEVTQPDELSASPDVITNVLCNGDADGTASFNAIGGVAPLTFNAVNNGTGAPFSGQSLTSLPAGNYTLTVQDANGCDTQLDFDITQPDAVVVVETDNQDVLCFGDSNGTSTASASGGTPPFTYNWGVSTGATTNLLPVGTHIVTVTDANGCMETLAVTIAGPAELELDPGQIDDAPCFGEATGTASVVATGGTPNYGFVWDANASGQTTQTATGLFAGDYTVTVTDASGCTQEVMVTVGEAGELSASGTPSNASCFGEPDGEIAIVPVGGTMPYTYEIGSIPVTGPIITGLVAGNYTVVVIDANGCSTTVDAEITQPDELMASTTSTPTLCFDSSDGTATVTVNGGTAPFTFSWSNGQATSTATGLPFGTATVDITDGNGCVTSVTADVTRPDEVELTMAMEPVLCKDGVDGKASVIAIGGIAPYTYEWVGNNSITSEASGFAAGSATVRVTDANGCIKEETIMITEPATEVGLIPGVINRATCGEDNGSVSIMGTGGTSPYTYAWSSGATTENATDLSPGNVTVTVTDANGCTYEETFNVSEPDALQISDVVPVNVSCFGGSDGSINITAIGGSMPYVFSWTGDVTSALEDLTGLAAGTYTILITDGDDCTVSQQIVITEPTELVIDEMRPSEAGCGESDGEVALTASGGTGDYTYSWSNGMTTQNAIGVPLGNYCVTVTDENGCTAEGCIDVLNPNPPMLTFVKTDVNCKDGNDGTIDLTVTGGTPPYQYTWTGGLTGDDQNAVIAGSYTIMVRDAANCEDVAMIVIDEPATELEVMEDNIVLATCGEANGSVSIMASGGTSPYTYAWSNSATSQNINSISPGTYDVTVTDANGCTVVGSYNVSEPNALQIIDKIPTNVLCFGGNDGAIDITVAGGRTPYVFSWQGGVATQNRTGLTAGTYVLTVTDADDCSVEANVVVTQPDELLVDAITPSLASCGEADGNISMTIVGGTMPYTYSWTGNTSPNPVEDPDQLTAGEYFVTITDANGCEVETMTEIINPDAPVASAVTEDVKCFGEANGAVTIDVVNGTPPYTYQWSAIGGTEQSPTTFTAGTYSVTVTDAANCSDVIDNIEIAQPDALALTLDELEEATCGQANGIVSVTIAGGLTPYGYLWSDGGVTEDRDDLSPGIYQLTITDRNGCEFIEEFEVIEPDALQANGVVDDVNCFEGADGSITVSTQGGNTPYFYEWSSGETMESITGKTEGTYILTVTDNDGCTFVLTETIGQPTAISLSAIPTFATCNNADGAIDLDVQGGTSPYTYEWSGGTGALPPTQDAVNLTPGSYLVIVTDANGCSRDTSVSVVTPGGLEVSSVAKDAECNGNADGGISVDVSGGVPPYFYSWSNGETTEDVNDLIAGVYTLTVTDTDGCTYTETVLVSEPDLLVPIIQLPFAGPSCNGGSDASINVSVMGGTAPYSFQWDNGAGIEQNPNGLPAGDYNVIVTDANGCTATDGITLVEPDPIEVSISVDNADCFGEPSANIDISVTGGTVGLDYVYNWSAGLAATQDQNSILAGLYSLTVTDDNGCEKIVSINVDQPNELALRLTEESDNGGYNVSCSDSDDGFARVIAQGGTAPYTYRWASGATTELAENLTAGFYEVTVIDSKGCEDIIEVEITGPAAITVDAVGQGPTCFGEGNGFITFANIQGGIGPYIYSLDNSPFTPLPRFGNLDGGEYTLKIQDANGCEWSEDLSLVEPEELVVELGDNEVIEFGESLTLFPEVTPSSANITFDWVQGIDSANQAVFNPTVTPQNGSTYKIIIEDEKGCRAEDLVIVQVSKERPVFIPNVFSPNGDTENEFFTIYAKPGVVANVDRMIIFDRWGNVLFERTDFPALTGNNYNDPDGWDGTFKGETMNPAVFVYMVEVTYFDGSKDLFEGDVTLSK